MFGFDMLSMWHWFGIALLLGIIEVMSFTVYLFWMALAALLTGLFVYFFPHMPAQMQWGLFALFSLLSIVIWLFAGKKAQKNLPEHPLNHRPLQYIGRTIMLESPIENGFGKVRLDDSLWRVTGEDMPVGTKVKIVSADGIILRVEQTE